MALCKPEEASDEKLAVLITPMLLKVLGNGRGMASASGSIPSASQTPKYDIPLKHSCTVLVRIGAYTLHNVAQSIGSHLFTLDSIQVQAGGRKLHRGSRSTMA